MHKTSNRCGTLKYMTVPLLVLVSCLLGLGCATPLAEGKLISGEPVSKIISADANSIYHAIKRAMDEFGYPAGIEDLPGGVVESKWVPVGAGSHYVDLFEGKDFGANGAYYKMVVKIKPLESGKCMVEARTDVKSIVNGMKSTGDKERDILAKIALHARGYDVTVTNLGVEE